MPETTTSGITALSPAPDRRAELIADVRAGLGGNPPTLPPKYFYDARGSALFEQITQLDEYYPTRTETAILEAHAGEIAQLVGPDAIVELGSGSSRKTRLLLEAMHTRGGRRYVPVDVSHDAIAGAASALEADYPWLQIDGYLGDFNTDLHHLPHDGTRLIAFLGSTIGNLDRDGRHRLLAEVAATLDPDEAFLLGADLVKSTDVLLAAYDDAQGVTAAFNRNILSVLARELGADLPIEAFCHEARWNARDERIEMWLVATTAVTLDLREAGVRLELAAGEGIRTELSCKFRRRGLEAELRAAGLRVERWWTDPDEQFALLLARAA